MKANVSFVGVSDAVTLVGSLKRGEIDGAVRGVLSSAQVIKQLKTDFGLKEVMRTAILEDVRGKQFLLAPVGIDEGSDRESRLALVETTAAYFRDLGWDISIGILSKGRPEDRSRSDEVKMSLEDGEWLVEALRRSGLRAEHFGILVEDAVSKAELIVAPDGVTGNLMFRSIHFIGGGKAYGAPVVNLGRVFVDTSRAKSTYSDSILLAAGLVEMRSGR